MGPRSMKGETIMSAMTKFVLETVIAVAVALAIAATLYAGWRGPKDWRK